MTELAETFRDMKKHNQIKREKRLLEAQHMSRGWTKHTPYHWSRVMYGQRVEWWPSTGRLRYANKTFWNIGNVIKRIKENKK